MAKESSSAVKTPRLARGALLDVVLVSLLTFICFSPALSNGFVDWDDDVLLVRNTGFRGLGWPQIRYAFTSFLTGPYQPLAWISYSADWALWGLEPRGFHFTNVLLHSLTAAAFYFLARKLIDRAVQGVSAQSLRLGAIAAALAFAVHPLRTESVVWAAERRDVLCGAFYVLTLLAYLQYVDRSKRRGMWLLVTLSLYIACLLAKASAMTMPLVLLILDAFPMRRRLDLRVWVEKVPFLVLSVAAAIVALIGQRQGADLQRAEDFGFLPRLATAAFSTCFYLVKAVAPTGLIPMYERPMKFEPFEARFVLSAVCTVGITVVVVLKRRRIPGLCAAWLCYIVTLAPVSGLMQSGWQIAADRYTYLPMMGFAVLSGGLVATWTDPQRLRKHLRFVLAVCSAAVVLTVWGVLSLRQSSFWQSGESLWRHVLVTNPKSGFAESHLAVLAAQRGDGAAALARASRSVELRPDFALHWGNLAVLLEASGRKEEAMLAFERAASAAPESPTFVTEYAERLLRVGRVDEAEKLFRRVLDLDAFVAKAIVGITICRARHMDPVGAEEYSQRAMRAPGVRPDAFTEIAKEWFLMDQPRRAIDVLRTGVHRYPENESLAIWLAWILATYPRDDIRNGAEAVGLAQPFAGRVGPRQDIAIKVLAAALAEKGDMAGARRAIADVIARTRRIGQSVEADLEELQADFQAGRPVRRLPYPPNRGPATDG